MKKKNKSSLRNPLFASKYHLNLSFPYLFDSLCTKDYLSGDNRLVGDVQPDCEHPITYTSNAFFNAQSPLLPAGLLGPVTVMVKKGR